MAKYRKKPVAIEAVRWDGKYTSPGEWPDWFRGGVERGAIRMDSHDNGGPLMYDGTLTIETLEGNHRANIGDFIIRGVKGELYPCKPDIFAATYEEA